MFWKPSPKKKVVFWDYFFLQRISKNVVYFFVKFFQWKNYKSIKTNTHWSLGSWFFSWGAPKSEARLPPLFLTVIYTKSKKTAFLQALPYVCKKCPQSKLCPPPDKTPCWGKGWGKKTKKSCTNFWRGSRIHILLGYFTGVPYKILACTTFPVFRGKVFERVRLSKNLFYCNS